MSEPRNTNSTPWSFGHHITNSLAQNTMSLPQLEFISCERFFELLEQAHRPRSIPKIGQQLPPRNPRVSIFDIRPPEDYDNSRIAVNQCLNIHPEDITMTMTAAHLEYRIKQRALNNGRHIEHILFAQRRLNHTDVIVLVDWGTTSENFSENNPLNVLRTIMQKTDPGGNPPPYVILNGGFREWLFLYPELTTNAGAVPPENWEPKNIPGTLKIPDCFAEWPKSVPEAAVFKPTQFSRVERTEVLRTLELLEEIAKLHEELRRMREKWMKMVKDILDAEERHEPMEQELELKFKQLNERVRMVAEMIVHREQEVESIDVDVHWFVDEEAKAKNYMEIIQSLKDKLRKLDKEEVKLKERVGKIAENKSAPPEEPLLSQPDLSASQESRFIPVRSETDVTYTLVVDLSSIQEESQEKSQSVDDEEQIFDRPPANIFRKRRKPEPPIAKLSAPGTTGIHNSGNTCYVNTVLQCLAHLDELTNYFVSVATEFSGNVCQQFKDCLEALWSGKKETISAQHVKLAVAMSKATFRTYQQQDCHEFLTALLELMHNELKERIELDIDQAKSPEMAMNEALEGNVSIISETFYGQVRSILQCNVCEYQSVNRVSKYDVFMALDVPVQDRQENSLVDCIKNYFGDSEVEDWQCQECQEKREATRTVELIRAPPVLIIQLVRYIHIPDGSAVKNSAKVEYQMELEISIGDGENRTENYIYHLRGIACHLGRDLRSGHYIAFCKNSMDNKWYKFDDTVVTHVAEEAVLKQNSQVYLLFYSLKQSSNSQAKGAGESEEIISSI